MLSDWFKQLDLPMGKIQSKFLEEKKIKHPPQNDDELEMEVDRQVKNMQEFHF